MGSDQAQPAVDLVASPPLDLLDQRIVDDARVAQVFGQLQRRLVGGGDVAPVRRCFGGHSYVGLSEVRTEGVEQHQPRRDQLSAGSSEVFVPYVEGGQVGIAASAG